MPILAGDIPLKESARHRRTRWLGVALLVAGTTGAACFRTPLEDGAGPTADGSIEHLDVQKLKGARADIPADVAPDFAPELRPDLAPEGDPATVTFASVSAGGYFARGLSVGVGAAGDRGPYSNTSMLR